MQLIEREKPSPAPHEALLRIESCGVCGSDIHYYLDGCIGSQQLQGPTVLGHEYAGVVEAVGSDADPSLVGKRVAVEPGIPCMRCEWCRTGHYNVCRDMFFPGGPGKDGAFCDYFCVHAGFCYPLPDSVRADEAAMLEPLAVAVHTVELAQLRPGDTALVVGLGPIGLLTAQVLKHMGAQTVYGADLLDYRVEAGRRFGVDAAWNARQEDTVSRILEETGGRGVDVAFDCSNRSEPLSQCVHAARPAGRVVMTGISGEEDDPMPVSAARRKELTLQWCRRFRHNYPAAIALLAAGSVDVRGLITHSFPLERTQEAFELVANYADNVLKASIDW
jgi:L-iditol 2-dehydrogenase